MGDFRVQFNGETSEEIIVQVYQLGGQMLKSESSFSDLTGEFSRTISLDGFPSGIYQIVVICGDESFQRKLVKQ